MDSGDRKKIASLIASVLLMNNFFADDCQASEKLIDASILIRIESAGNLKAINKKTQARGLFQITPIVLKEYNDHHDTNISENDLFLGTINTIIAHWYLEVRIPELLRHFNQPITTQRILWAYNAGIKNVIEGRIPKETREYINRYNKLREEKLSHEKQQ